MPSIWEYFRLFFANGKELEAAGIPPDLLRWPQFVVCSILLALILFLVIYFRNKTSKKGYKITILTIWATMCALEIVKIFWSTFVEFDGKFGWSAFPLYTCSIFMYVCPIIIWMNKDHWFKDSTYAWITSWMILGGLVNFCYPTVMKHYPVLHFLGFHTMFYHGALVFCGLFTLTTKQYKLMNILDACRAMWIVGLFSIPSICINHFFNVDCMFLNGVTFPLTLISEPINNNVGLWLWIVIMFLIYLLMMCIFELPGTIIKIKSGGSLLPKQTKKVVKKKTHTKTNINKRKRA